MAILLVIVMVPPLFIYNPERDSGDPNGPPTSVRRLRPTPPEVKQKLYILFIVPGAVAALAVFLYVVYYRPLRYTQYCVEQALEKNHLKREIGKRQLEDRGLDRLLYDAEAPYAPHRSMSMSTFRLVSTEMLEPSSDSGSEPNRNGRNNRSSANSGNQKKRDHKINEGCCLRAAMCVEVESLRLAVFRVFVKEAEHETDAFLEAVHERLSGITA